MHRPRYRLFVDVEPGSKGLNQSRDATRVQIHHEIHVVGLTGNAVDGARERPAEVIGNSEPVQDFEHEKCDAEAFRIGGTHRPD